MNLFIYVDIDSDLLYIGYGIQRRVHSFNGKTNGTIYVRVIGIGQRLVR